MANIQIKFIEDNVSRSHIESHHLDTIQLTCDKSITESRVSQYYKGLRKQRTNVKLTKIESVIKHLNYTDGKTFLKRIERTKNCLSIALQDGDKLIQSRCNQSRLCQNCARAESAKRIQEYKHQLTNLSKEDGLYFVTLTAPTCAQRELKSTIDKRIRAFAKVKNNMSRRYSQPLTGLRKLEVTHNKETDRYHPHFHFLIQGESQAMLLRDLWLKQFSDASVKAQDIRKIEVTENNHNNLIEVFKYATKGLVKDNVDALAEYHILRAIDKKRIFQTFGNLKKTPAPALKETDISQLDWIAPSLEIYAFEPKLSDWTSATKKRLVNLTSIDVSQYKNSQLTEKQKQQNEQN
jgi:plasmid rolling circle replication initiator protein Rep